MRLSLVGPSQDKSWIAELEHALKAERLGLHTQPSLAAENATLRTEVNFLCSSVETLCCNRMSVVMKIQNARDLTAVPEKVRAVVGTLRMWKTKVEGDVCEIRALTTMESARVRAVVQELVTLMLKLAVSRVKYVNSL